MNERTENRSSVKARGDPQCRGSRSIIGARAGVNLAHRGQCPPRGPLPNRPHERPPERQRQFASAHWATLLAEQWRYRQLVKIAGICAFLWVFFAAYFHVLRHPWREPTVMPLTALDAWVPFQPAAFWAYVSLWIYIGLAPALMPTMAAGLRHAVWAAALCVCGLLCFWLWPTAVPASLQRVDATLAEHAGFALLRGVDAAGNACPSLHVASAVFSAMAIGRVLSAARAPWPLHLLNLAWLLAIAWSTLAIRQHVVLDVIAGTLLGLVFGLASARWLPALPRPTPGAAAIIRT